MPLAFELDAANLALNILAVGLGVIGVLAAAAVFARSASTKAHLELLRGEVADHTARSARIEGENKGLLGENGILKAQLEKEREEKAVLTDLATGRNDVREITEAFRTELHQLTDEIRAIVDVSRAGGGGGHVPERPSGGPSRR